MLLSLLQVVAIAIGEIGNQGSCASDDAVDCCKWGLGQVADLRFEVGELVSAGVKQRVDLGAVQGQHEHSSS